MQGVFAHLVRDLRSVARPVLALSLTACESPSTSPSPGDAPTPPVIGTLPGGPPPTLSPVVATVVTSLSAGYFHTCAIAPDKRAYCWGSNEQGQLGDGTTTRRLAPTVVVGGLAFTSISAGARQTCGIAIDRRAYCWGRGYGAAPARVDGEIELVDVTVGMQHACALAASGGAYCWGDNSLGALGTGDRSDRSAPTPVMGGLTFTSLSAGWNYTCGVTGAGAGFCWGEGDALGSAAAGVCDRDGNDYPITCVATPVPISGGHRLSRIGAGESFTCALAVDGTAYCWGRLYGGAVRPTVTPEAVPAGHGFLRLDVDAQRACGIDTDGRTLCWGSIPEQSASVAAPIPLEGDVGLGAVSVGWFHSCGIASNGVAYCWGRNETGALGDGSLVSSASPVKVATQP